MHCIAKYLLSIQEDLFAKLASMNRNPQRIIHRFRLSENISCLAAGSVCKTQWLQVSFFSFLLFYFERWNLFFKFHIHWHLAFYRSFATIYRKLLLVWIYGTRLDHCFLLNVRVSFLSEYLKKSNAHNNVE